MSLSSSFMFHFMDQYDDASPKQNIVRTKAGPLLLGDLTAQNLQLLSSINHTPSKIAIEAAAPLSARLMTPRSAASAPIAIVSSHDTDLELVGALEAKNAQMRARIKSNSSRDGASAGSTDAPDEDPLDGEEGGSLLDSSCCEDEEEDMVLDVDYDNSPLYALDNDQGPESFAVFADVESEDEDDDIFRMDL